MSFLAHFLPNSQKNVCAWKENTEDPELRSGDILASVLASGEIFSPNDPSFKMNKKDSYKNEKRI